jgi:predicted transposase/invertase (TIGR01784 family)
MDLAVRRLKQLSADERTRMLYEARELAVMDEMARTRAAVTTAVTEKQVKIAKNMLNSGLDVAMISKLTELSPGEIRKLEDRV